MDIRTAINILEAEAAITAASSSVSKDEERMGSQDQILKQSYSIIISGISASLIILDYGNEDPGRVVKSIQVYPESARGKGFAQALYLAALRDGPIHERPEFQSEDARRAVNRMIEKGLVRRQEVDGRTLLVIV